MADTKLGICPQISADYFFNLLGLALRLFTETGRKDELTWPYQLLVAA